MLANVTTLEVHHTLHSATWFMTVSEMLIQLTMIPSASNADNYSILFNRFSLLLLLMSYTVLSASVIQIEKASVILFTASVNLLKVFAKLI